MLPLPKVVTLCEELQVTPRSLFGTSVEQRERREVLSIERLAELVRQSMAARKLTLDEFGHLVEWELRPFPDDPESVWEWNIECLRAVCDQVGVDWLSVLPESATR